MEKHPHSYTQVRYQDCDPLSHLNNGRYIDYFMNAREDHLVQYYGLNVYERLKSEGRGWVVGKSEIIYRKPAWLMEEVLIRSQVNNYSIKHIEVEMAMYDKSESHLKSLIRSVFIPIDARTNKAVEHADEIMELLKAVHVEGITTNIEERVAELEGKMSMA